MITKLIRERYGRRLLDGGDKNVDKKNGLKEEVKKDLGEADLLTAEQKEPAQKPLFGDLDLIINTLETEATEIRKQIEKARDSIGRKEEEASNFEERLTNIQTSLSQIREKLAVEKKEKEAGQEEEEKDGEEDETAFGPETPEERQGEGSDFSDNEVEPH